VRPVASGVYNRGGRRGRAPFAAFLLVGSLFAAGSAEAAAIRGIRPTNEGESTRVVIEVTETTPYRWGLVPADSQKGLPPRFFVDIEGVRIDPRQKLDLTVSDPRLRQIRAGQNTLGRARVVMDLTSPVTPTVFALQSPARIVIDLRGPGVAPSASSATVAGSAPVSPPAAAAPAPRPQLPSAPTPSASQSAVASAAGSGASSPERPVIVTGKPGATVVKSAAVTVPKARRVRVVIDAGHGGKDPGARGPHGAVEKDITLDISRRLAKKLRDRLGFDVTMTRQGDQYISLGGRKDVANRLDADLFVSIHANAAKNKRSNGIETYYLKNSNDRATLRLANLENGVDMLIGGDVSTDADLSYILSDIIQGQKEADSIRAARHIQDSLVGEVRPLYTDIDDLGVKQGPFLVLDGTYMAAVLVETGFVSNSTEAKRLLSSSYRESLAEGMYDGIQRYFEDDRTALLR
jgi:N-acetylmuramoyl-L-alanine amidase